MAFAAAFGIILACLVAASGKNKLVFRPLMHQPRIYHGAPPGVHVTTVHAYDPESPRNNVIYNLPFILNYDYFHLDKASGNLTTAKAIDREIGEQYQIMVAAISFGNSEVERLDVVVTDFNQFAPRFNKSIYKAELPVQSPLGTLVLRVQAVDPDPEPHNAEIYYRMDQNASTYFFALDPLSGELTLAQTINTTVESLVFGIFAEDGGSPKRWAQVLVEISLKNISAPVDVMISNITQNSALVCWHPPEFGNASRYTVQFRKSKNNAKSFKNVSSNDKNVSSNDTCITLYGLKAGTEYTLHVFGRHLHTTGQSSVEVTFNTSSAGLLLTSYEPEVDCVQSTFGSDCESFDPCLPNPCDNGECHNLTSNDYECKCKDFFIGQNCSVFDPCGVSPCGNGGSCLLKDNQSFECICPPSYYGEFCEFRDLCILKPCKHGGMCNKYEDDFYCDCAPWYTGTTCETELNDCYMRSCSGHGACVDEKCICNGGYEGNDCEKSVECPSDVASTHGGVIYWNKTAHGSHSKAACPHGSHEYLTYASRMCLLLQNGTVTWGEMDERNCSGMHQADIEQLADIILEMTSNLSTINVKLSAAVKELEQLTIRDFQDKEMAQELTNVISMVMNADDALLRKEDNQNVSDTLLQVVNDIASNVPLKPGENTSFETENLRIQAVRWHPQASFKAGDSDGLKLEVPVAPSVTTRIRTGNSTTTFVPTPDNDEEPYAANRKMVQVYLSSEALVKAHEEIEDDVRIKFVVYYNHKLFRPKNEDRVLHNPVSSSTKTSSNEDFNNKPTPSWTSSWTSKWTSSWTTSSTSSTSNTFLTSVVTETPVVQVSLGNVCIKNLEKPFVFTFPLSIFNEAKCVYWLEKEHLWSTDGLLTNQTEESITCTSSHLTAFSILLDPTPTDLIDPIHERILSSISHIGCILSMLGLGLTIFTYLLFRCLNCDHMGKILLNLCVALFTLNLSYLLGTYPKENPKKICPTIGLMLHYSLISSMSWMCVEAFNMHQLLIRVFTSYEMFFMLKRMVFAWGLPLLFVGATFCFGLENYYDDTVNCVLTPKNPVVYYAFFVGPTCVILFINLIIFVMVTKVLFSQRLSVKSLSGRSPVLTLAQIRGTLTVMVLLGVTWVYGTFAIGEARVVFQYFFCIFNSLQGFVIFLVRCLLYPEAQSAWVQLIKYRKLKKYKGTFPPGVVGWSTSSHLPGKNNVQSSISAIRMNSGEGSCTTSTSDNFWSKMDAQPKKKGIGKYKRRNKSSQPPSHRAYVDLSSFCISDHLARQENQLSRQNDSHDSEHSWNHQTNVDLDSTTTVSQNPNGLSSPMFPSYYEGLKFAAAAPFSPMQDRHRQSIANNNGTAISLSANSSIDQAINCAKKDLVPIRPIRKNARKLPDLPVDVQHGQKKPEDVARCSPSTRPFPKVPNSSESKPSFFSSGGYFREVEGNPSDESNCVGIEENLLDCANGDRRDRNGQFVQIHF